MPQPTLLATATSVLAPIILILAIISIVSAPIDSIHTISIPIITSFVYVPLATKGKASKINDDYNLPLFTFEIRSSSIPMLSYS